MANRIRRHLSFANVTSVMALFFAMGGTGYALTCPRTAWAAGRSSVLP
jgi:exoribonuclease II